MNKQKSTIELIEEMEEIEKAKELLDIKYELARQELVRRFPFLEQEEVFKKKDEKNRVR